MKKIVFISLFLVGLIIPIYSYASALDYTSSQIETVDSDIIDKKEYFQTSVKEHKKHIFTNTLINDVKTSTKNFS